MSTKAEAVPDVDIDSDGRFKYVLIRLYINDEDFKHIVRGYAWGEYHADIYDDCVSRVSPLGLETQCVGGGRILHKSEDKTIEVYGYSQGFGRADHSVTVDLLKKHYPEYTSITFRNDGY